MTTDTNTNTYIQGHDTSTLQSHQSRSASIQASYLLPHIQPTHHILDIGCGPGTITCGLASAAPQGHTTGIDSSPEAIASARAEASRRNITNITFDTGSALSLPFPDNSFDIVHCHALLIHLPTPTTALREMRRICKPGGYVAAREPDWSTCVIHPYDARLERWKAAHARLKELHGAEPNAGRHLLEWAVEVGFEPGQVSVDCDVLQYTGRESVKWWGELYAARMGTEFGKRAVEFGVATDEEVKGFADAYLDWSRCGIAVWAMMHMRLLARK